MAYDVPLRSDPSPLPLKPAILLLLNKRRRAAFISYTTNARGRAAVLASMIRHRDKNKRNHLRDLPEGGIGEFALLALNIDLPARKAADMIERYQKKFIKDGFKLFGGARSAIPLVALNGRRMTLVEAIDESKTKSAYQTVYRRIQRGWPVKQALDIEAR